MSDLILLLCRFVLDLWFFLYWMTFSNTICVSLCVCWGQVRQGLAIYPSLAPYSQCNPPVSASHGLVLQARAPKPGYDSLSVFTAEQKFVSLLWNRNHRAMWSQTIELTRFCKRALKQGRNGGRNLSGFSCFITKSCGKAEMKPQASLLTGLALEERLVSRSAKVRRKLGLFFSYIQTPDLLSFAWFGVSKTQNILGLGTKLRPGD